MDINKLKKEDLLQLQVSIESRLQALESLSEEVKISTEINSLNDLDHSGRIFCVNFNGDDIYHLDYVTLNLQRSTDHWVKVEASHPTKPLGCRITIREELMSNHCFLHDFTSSMYFFTLKPQTWKEDLVHELERTLKNKRAYFNQEIIMYRQKIQSLIKSPQLDTFVNNLK